MVDCGSTENFTTASHRDRWKKRGEWLGGGKFLASSICVPAYCMAMHIAMHADVVCVEGGVLIAGRCLYSPKKHSINTAPNSHLRSYGYQSLLIASMAIAPSNDWGILSTTIYILIYFPFGTRTLDDNRWLCTAKFLREQSDISMVVYAHV